MEILKQIERTREYLDYIQEHFENVQKCWEIMKEKCNCIFRKIDIDKIEKEIQNHDLSKLSEFEFVQYRKAFYPTEKESNSGEYDFTKAWENHKRSNSHHWQNWTRKNNNWVINCVCMVVDWMAMGLKFGGTAESYYESKKSGIKIPIEMVPFMENIFKNSHLSQFFS